MADEEKPAGWELTLPFVVCQSEGGPYDDRAYVAGWEMGMLAGRLRAARPLGLGLPTVTIHEANRPMLDLLAMEIGATLVDLDWPGSVDGWALIRLEWAR